MGSQHAARALRLRSRQAASPVDHGPEAHATQLSACIVNWNTRDLLRECLRRLDEPAGRPETVVVDNGSADGSSDMVRKEFPWARIIANEENLGYARANNQAIQATSGELVLLLNPDAHLLPGALDELVRFVKDHPKAAAAAPQLLNPDGSIQRSARGFPAPAALLYEVAGFSRLFPRSRRFGAYRMTYWGHDTEREVDQPMASALVVRRKALAAVGGFDEQFPVGGHWADVDLCYRLRQAGWSIHFLPAAKAIHHLGGSTRQVRRRALRESHQGLVYFYRKHYLGRTPALIYWPSMWAIRSGWYVRDWIGRACRAT